MDSRADGKGFEALWVWDSVGNGDTGVVDGYSCAGWVVLHMRRMVVGCEIIFPVLRSPLAFSGLDILEWYLLLDIIPRPKSHLLRGYSDDSMIV